MVTYCVRRGMFVARNLLARAKLHRPSHLTADQRHLSSDSGPSPGTAFCLDKRGLVQVKGRDAVDLLQGLVTSDVTELTDINGCGAQYSMMLNVQGRVMYDLIFYNISKILGDVCLLVECDDTLKQDFIKTVKRYKIRKKVELADVSDEYQVWFQPSGDDPTRPAAVAEPDSEGEQQGNRQIPKVPGSIFTVLDPRVPSFGKRVLFRKGEESLALAGESGGSYESLRHRWGIPEGPIDLPPGDCTPLESNLTIMQGVSFTKGCYIGQELTARTHHTGVIRKRLVPLVFDGERNADESGSTIINEKGKNAGKVRAAAGVTGLGLVRLQYQGQPLFVEGKDGHKTSLSFYRPGWWPSELHTQ